MRQLAEVTSTNDALRAWASAGAPHGSAVLAASQTAGRGRLGRTWRAPAGAAVLLSVLVRRPLPAHKVPLLSLGAAVATAQACGAATRIKWPNDVLAPDGRKLAGVLCEAEWGADGLGFAILGIGVNVTAAPPLPTATYLAELGPPPARVALAQAIVDGVLRQVRRIEEAPAEMLADWRERSVTLGRAVQVGGLSGTAMDVDPDGALRILQADGTEVRAVTGDLGFL